MHRISTYRTFGYCAFIVFLLHTGESIAGIILLKSGRIIDTSVQEPFYPTDSSECYEYAANIETRQRELSKLHDQCLADNSTSPKVTSSSPHICSNSACQNLHTARDEINQLNASSCFQNLQAYLSKSQKRSVTPRSETYSTVREITSATRKGPKSYLQEKATEAVKSAVAKSRKPVAQDIPKTDLWLSEFDEPSDIAAQAGISNPAAREIGSQSASAARASLGEALIKLDASLTRSDLEIGSPADNRSKTGRVSSDLNVNRPTAEQQRKRNFLYD